MYIFFIFLLVAFIGGSNAALVKLSVREFPPALVVFLRFLFAAIIISPFVFRRRIVIEKKTKKYILLTGLTFAINILLFAVGIQYTSVIMSQIIYVPSGLLVAIIGFIFLKEKLSKNEVAGLILSLVGMAVLIQGSIKTQDTLSFGKPIGNVLIVVGLFSWSLYLVFSRKLSKTYSPLTINFFSFTITLLLSLPFAIFEYSIRPFNLSQVTLSGILGLAGLVILSSIAFYFFYQWVIKYTSAFISSLVLYIIPIFAAVFGTLFFSEKLTTTLVLGSLLIFFGVFYAMSHQYVRKYLRSVLQ